MTTTPTTADRFRLGAPQTRGPLTIHPVFGPRGRVRCRSLSAGIRRGVRVREVPGGRVNTVAVRNPTDLPVLLYEGELILGAAQNRTIDQPVLVPAGVTLEVGVSCVEAGRWDVDGAEGTAFRCAPDALDPSLRSAKRASAFDAAGRPDQQEVWGEVSARLRDFGVDAPSESLGDLYDARRGDLEGLSHGFELVPGQLGAVVHVAGRPVALDLVGAPRVLRGLFPRLVRGYALQALATLQLTPAPPPPGVCAGPEVDDSARALLHAALGTGWRWLPGVGMGDLYAPRGPVAGCALRVGRELVACSAFPVTA